MEIPGKRVNKIYFCPRRLYFKVKLISEDLGELAADTVRVRFLASPINPSDLNQIEGTYPIKPRHGLPAVGGNEGVARVEEIGKMAVGFNLGDLVVPAAPALGKTFLLIVNACKRF